jgi:hypothetical protein
MIGNFKIILRTKIVLLIQKSVMPEKK